MNQDWSCHKLTKPIRHKLDSAEKPTVRRTHGQEPTEKNLSKRRHKGTPPSLLVKNPVRIWNCPKSQNLRLTRGSPIKPCRKQASTSRNMQNCELTARNLNAQSLESTLRSQGVPCRRLTPHCLVTKNYMKKREILIAQDLRLTGSSQGWPCRKPTWRILNDRSFAKMGQDLSEQSPRQMARSQVAACHKKKKKIHSARSL